MRFDEQAGYFDKRAGLSADVCDTIARAIAWLAHLEGGDLLLEVGTGTGQIGLALCGLPLCYIGFDASAAMLEIFERRRLEIGRTASFTQADGNNRWPVDDGSVKAVFSSRAIHQLPQGHVVDEVFRVASPDGASLVLGRVQREKQSLRARLRREMRERLRQLGYAGREGQEKEQAILDACVLRSAARIERQEAASWPVQHSAAEVLASWRRKSGLGGVDVPDDIKENVLSELADWAKGAFGSLDAVISSEEKYVLEGVRLPITR